MATAIRPVPESGRRHDLGQVYTVYATWSTPPGLHHIYTVYTTFFDAGGLRHTCVFHARAGRSTGSTSGGTHTRAIYNLEL